MGIALNPATSGPVVNESMETTVSGVFACGNVLHVHDLVDYVSEESANAGRYAAFYIQHALAEEKEGKAGGQRNKEGGMEAKESFGKKKDCRDIAVKCKGGVRYTVPSSIRATGEHPGDSSFHTFVYHRAGSCRVQCYPHIRRQLVFRYQAAGKEKGIAAYIFLCSRIALPVSILQERRSIM